MPNERLNKDRLIAFAAGELAEQEARAIEAMLVEDPEASRLVELYRVAAHSTATDDSVPPPAPVVERAKRIARVAASSEPVAGWLSRLQEVIATLVFDSRRQTLAVRDQTAAERIQMAYQVDDLEVEIQAEQVGGAWRIIGQIDAEAPLQDVEVALTRVETRDIVAVTTADDRGMFALDADRGRYDVHLRLPERSIVLRDVNLA